MEQSQFDGILFHERNIKPRDLPSKEQRRPDQVYIHYNLESPVWSSLNIAGKLINSNRAYQVCKSPLSGLESFFNISLSYREDADVKNVYYGLVRRVKTPGENLADIIEKFGAENQHLGGSRLYFRPEMLEWFS